MKVYQFVCLLVFFISSFHYSLYHPIGWNRIEETLATYSVSAPLTLLAPCFMSDVLKRNEFEMK